MNLLAWLVETAARNLVLAALAGGLVALLRPRRAVARLRVWSWVLWLCLAMPALQVLAPAWQLRLHLPPPAAGAASPGAATAVAAPPEPFASARAAAPRAPLPASAPAPSWPGVALAGYALVALGLLAQLLARMVRARRWVRRARPIALPAGAPPVAAAVLESGEVRAPATAGLARAVILLPAGWRAWPQEQLAAALAHEQEHVDNRDALHLGLAGLHRALFWFSPLGWWLPRHLAELAEGAGDDAALRSGIEPPQYAQWLLQLARARPAAAALVPMAAPARVERRVDAILQWKKEERMQQKKLWTVSCLVALAPLAVLVAASRPALAPMPARMAGGASASGFDYALVVRPQAALTPGKGACQFTSYDGWAYVAFGENCAAAAEWNQSADFTATVSEDAVVFRDHDRTRRFAGAAVAQAAGLFAALDAGNAKQLYLARAQLALAAQLLQREQRVRALGAAREQAAQRLVLQAALYSQRAAAATGAAREAALTQAKMLQVRHGETAYAVQSQMDDGQAGIAALRQRQQALEGQLDALNLQASGQVRTLERGLRQLEAGLVAAGRGQK